MSKVHQDLEAKLRSRTARVGVVGLGYVGLPLACAFARHLPVTGFDIDAGKVGKLARGKSHVLDVTDGSLQAALKSNLAVTADPDSLSTCDFVIVAVPTPLTPAKEPDLGPLKSVAELLAPRLRRGQFVILESTTYPGTTEEVLRPRLEDGGLRAGIDFGLAHSPERIDPGNKSHNVENTPKLVGGHTPACTETGAALYGLIVKPGVVRVTDAKTAEAAKVYENIFRDVNIALVNEMALVCERLGIDIWEVVRAAATKPFGFMPFWPGPGVGGHCIPLDPHYMSYKARRLGMTTRFIELASEVNDYMRVYAVNLLEGGLRTQGKGLRGTRVAVCGLAYKGGVDDTRESQASTIIQLLHDEGAHVVAFDPRAKGIDTEVGRFVSTDSLEAALAGSAGAIFVTDHPEWKALGGKAVDGMLPAGAVVVDTRNLFRGSDFRRCSYVGLGKPAQAGPAKKTARGRLARPQSTRPS